MGKLKGAAQESGWNLDYGGIAMMWRSGCIIRSQFLRKIHDAFRKNPGPDVVSLLPLGHLRGPDPVAKDGHATRNRLSVKLLEPSRPGNWSNLRYRQRRAVLTAAGDHFPVWEQDYRAA